MNTESSLIKVSWKVPLYSSKKLPLVKAFVAKTPLSEILKKKLNQTSLQMTPNGQLDGYLMPILMNYIPRTLNSHINFAPFQSKSYPNIENGLNWCQMEYWPEQLHTEPEIWPEIENCQR